MDMKFTQEISVYTLRCAARRRPVLVLPPNSGTSLRRARAFLGRYGPHRLNVAGPREIEAPGIYLAARRFLERLFRAPMSQTGPRHAA